MKKNLPITEKELDYPAETRIVSTTDLKGAIAHFNQDFIDVSGYSEDEMLHKNHNIVRHPDMPPLAFADLWQTVQAGQPWMGIVKNRCKNGDHYWVDAFVSPVKQSGKVTGYQSVRIKPAREHVRRAEKLYASVNAGRDGGKRWLGKLLSGLRQKVFMGYLAVVLPLIAVVFWQGQFSTIALSVAGVVSVALAWWISHMIARPWMQAANDSRAIFCNDIAQQVYSGRSDELGQMQLAIKFLRNELNTVVWRISDAADSLDDIAGTTSSVAATADQGIQRQQLEIDQVATAMNEMVSTVQEVASHAATTAQASDDAANDVKQGRDVITQMTHKIGQLAEQVSRVGEVIQKLADDSEKIGGVVDVIREIAEQTNLLALNAAIEAARAGEEGRGFAVVADEVRTLAGRTQDSTNEIQQMIAGLQSGAAEAVTVTKQGQQMSDQSMAHVQETDQALASITAAVESINNRVVQIATAAEEQNSVSDEINRNITNINQVAESSAEASADTSQAAQELQAQVGRLREMVRQFAID